MRTIQQATSTLPWISSDRFSGISIKPSTTRHLASNLHRPRLSSWRWSQPSSVANDKTCSPVDATDIDSEVAIPLYKGKKAVVVGAGPAGSLAASFLAQHGFNVKVYDRRPDPATVEASMHRAFLIVLSPRSVETMKDAKVEIPPVSGEYVGGLCRYNGSYRISSKGRLIDNPRKGGFAVCGHRHDIVRHFLSNIRDQYRHNITFYFQHTCKDVSFENQTVAFVNGSDEAVQEDYDLLIVSDGTNSVVRSRLEDYDEDFHVDAMQSERCYKVVRYLDNKPTVNGVLSDTVRAGYLTFAAMQKSEFEGKESPGGTIYTMGQEGDVHFFVGSTKTRFENIKGHEDKWAEASLPEAFPREWKREFAKQLPTARVSQTPSLTRVSKLTGPKTMLLGDAGHSVPPTLGLGCNMAVQDSGALNAALEEADGDVEAAVKLYDATRHPEIRDLQTIQLTVGGSYTNRPLSTSRWLVLGIVHLMLHTIGSRLMPSLVPPSVYVRLNNDMMTPRAALNELKRETAILLGLLATGLVFVFRKAMWTAVRKGWSLVIAL